MEVDLSAYKYMKASVYPHYNTSHLDILESPDRPKQNLSLEVAFSLD